MGILQKILRHLLLGALAVCLAACESKQDLMDHMEAIEGEYRLVQVGPEGFDFFNILSEDERSLATARVFSHERKWVIEYSLPLLTILRYSSSVQEYSIRYHQIRQYVIWDRQLGQYLFSNLKQDDMPGDGFNPDLIRLYLDGTTFSFHNKNLKVSWTKNR